MLVKLLDIDRAIWQLPAFIETTVKPGDNLLGLLLIVDVVLPNEVYS